MCTYNVKIEDEVMEMVKPHFDGDAALRIWIERQLEKVMKEYAMQFRVSSSAEDKSEEIYQRVKALEQDPRGLFKLGSILKPSKYSAEELRDEYISEKYGI